MNQMLDSVYGTLNTKDDREKDACLSALSRKTHKMLKRKARLGMDVEQISSPQNEYPDGFPDELIPPCPEDLKEAS